MKKLIGLLLAAVLLSGCMAAAEKKTPALKKDLIILYTSDVHCGIDKWWGYAGLYEARKNLSGTNPVLLVDNGDALQGESIGTTSKGESIIDIMNAMDYDVVIPGNHDFDYGVDRFLELTKKADFPYICCNFNKQGERVFPHLIREIDGVRIAFVGVTTPETLQIAPKTFMDDKGSFLYGFCGDEDGTALYEVIQKSVDDSRAEGADYVILLAHLGNLAVSAPWRYDDVISHTTGIDAVLDGHSHDTEQVVMKNRDGRDVVRSACGTKLEHIGVLTIRTDGTLSSELYDWKASVSATRLMGLKNAASEIVEKMKEKIAVLSQTVVARSDVDLIIYDPVAASEGKEVRIIRNTETNLGDLVADAFLDQSGGADIAIANGGGIRSQLNRGEITMADVIEVFPFDNLMTVIEVTGQQILDAMEWSVHSMPDEFGGFLHVANMTYEVDPTLPTPCVEDENLSFDHIDESLQRRVRNVKIKGEPLDPEKTYSLASIEYLLIYEGVGYTMFRDCKVLRNSMMLDNQEIMQYMSETLGGRIGEGYEDPYGQGRMVSVAPQK